MPSTVTLGSVTRLVWTVAAGVAMAYISASMRVLEAM